MVLWDVSVTDDENGRVVGYVVETGADDSPPAAMAARAIAESHYRAEYDVAGSLAIEARYKGRRVELSGRVWKCRVMERRRIIDYATA